MNDNTQDDLYIQQIIADLDRKRAHIEGRHQLAPWQIAATIIGGAAACFVAGAVVFKLFH